MTSEESKEYELTKQFVVKLTEKCEIQKTYIDLLKRNNANMAKIANQYRQLFLDCRSLLGWFIIKTTGAFKMVQKIDPQKEG